MNRNSHGRRGRIGMVAMLAAGLLAAGSAFGQAPKKEEPLKPPTPPAVGTNWSPLMSMLVSIVLSGVVLAVAFIPSKRGHQD